MATYEKWRRFHYDMQQMSFGIKKAKAIDVAMALVATKPTEKGTIKAYHDALQTAWDMQLSFEKNKINYGRCAKFDKPVRFLPDTCQLDTQECFQHRNS